MFILVVAATSNEVNTTLDWLKNLNGRVTDHEVKVLISGVGSAATTYALATQLSLRKPDLAIQAGIGGSFSRQYPPVSTVLVRDEVFADLGVFDDGGFSDIFDLGLAAADEKPFENRVLVNRLIKNWQQLSLPIVRGATINCISSTQKQFSAIAKKYNAEVESMEGAAVHYTCILEDVPFLQIRTISNFVGERDKKNWMLKEAIAELNIKLQEILTFR